jgi:beta-lactamase regulating signal transducer with metallopeptidase domain
VSAALLEYALGNTLLAAPLAALAWALGRSGRSPAAAHLAWALVLVRLVMPPITDSPWLTLRVPLAGLVGGSSANAGLVRAAAPWPERSPAFAAPRVEAGPRPAWSAEVAAAAPPPGFGPEPSPRPSPRPAPVAAVPPPAQAFAIDPATAVAGAWIVGALLVAGWSLRRVAQFHRVLRAASAPAGPALVRLAVQSARDLRMPAGVRLLTTKARTSPFVWWCFGRPAIVLPAAIVAELPERELRLAIGHELAHVRRRDHVLRWFEWAATAWLWWNPLAWLARRGLRTHEELACDAMVLRALAAEPRDYGSCLLSVAESLSAAGFRPPAQACAMSDGGSLEQRIEFILSEAPRRRPAVALHALPVAVSFASLCCGVVANAQSSAAAPAPRAAGAASPVALAQDPAARTLRAAVPMAKSLDVEVVVGGIAVRRDEAVQGVELAATLRRSPGAGKDRMSDAEFAACLRDTRLVADVDDAGRVRARIVFPALAAADAAAARRHDERCRSNVEVDVAIKANGLTAISAATVAGSLRSEGDVGDLRLSVVSGDIDLLLPAAWQGTWHAATTVGDVQLQGFDEAHADRAKRGLVVSRQGTIGEAGAALVRLQAVTGSIRVTRAGGGGSGDAKKSARATVAPPSDDGDAIESTVRTAIAATEDALATVHGAAAEGREAMRAAMVELREVDDVVRTAAAAAREAMNASKAAIAEAVESTGDWRADLRRAKVELQRHRMRRDGRAGEAPPAPTPPPPPPARSPAEAADGLQVRFETRTIEIHDGVVRIGVKRLGADGVFVNKVFEAPSGQSTVELLDDGALRVTVESVGADGTVQKKVCEAPDFATFQRQYPGVLVERSAGGESPRDQDPAADRVPKPAK